MDFLNSFLQLLGGGHPQHQKPQQHQQTQPPDITYNPNPNTNIPYSAHSVADAKLGNQYTANPRASQFLGVDPARFGYPEDNTVSMPDITFNPNPNTRIPYSAHSIQDAQLGNQYTANPMSPQYKGIDPARFGYPADNTARRMPSANIGLQLDQNKFKLPRF